MYNEWHGLLTYLVNLGQHRSPRGLATREELGVKFRVQHGLQNIFQHPARNLNHRFAVAEWLWIMSGSNDLETIAQYNGVLRQFSDDGTTLFGAYGPRVMPHLPWLLAKLQESDTRQAVITIWKNSPPVTKDMPCTVSLQFLRRDNLINLIVGMRSSDIWLGLPYDFYVFSQLLNCVCGILKCQVGFVQFNLGSSHLYERDLVAARRVIEDYASGQSFVSHVSPGIPPPAVVEALIDPKNVLNYLVADAEEGYWKRYVKVLIGDRNDSLLNLTA